MDWIETVAHQCSDDSGLEPEVCIIELGGTVGDIESAPYVEASGSSSASATRTVHVSLFRDRPRVNRTKPTQHTVKELMGSYPDILVPVLRAAQPRDARETGRLLSRARGGRHFDP